MKKITLHERLSPIKVLTFYNLYSFFLAVILLIAYLAKGEYNLLGSLNPKIYLIAGGCYLASNIIVFSWIHTKPRSIAENSPVVFFIDIVLLTVMIQTSGGLSSGLGNLIIISVAVSNLLVRGVLGYAVAAWATISIFYSQIGELSTTSSFFQAGMLGALFFISAASMQAFYSRLNSSESLASKHAQTAAGLEELNELILQRIRTGIIVTSPSGEIQLGNDAAQKLLGIDDKDDRLPNILFERFNQWKQNPTRRTAPFKTDDRGPFIQVNFSQLQTELGSGTLIFLEDITQATQEAQQLKLASLGRFTAGIAHEIRNPLGAISHAAQLLNESPDLNQADLRLSAIIQNHSVRMNKIIENILQLSRRKVATQSKIQLQPWLKKFVIEYKETHKSDASIELLIQPNLIAFFDESQLQQVLHNLCQNGLRYSLQQTGAENITITAGTSSINDLPYIEVQDYGHGIDNEDKNHLFEPFFSKDNHEGTGLGLYLSRELCEANHARLAYLDTQEVGACFRITFAHPDKLA
jgi:two-component system sensor histidine kinase PilS (NtrC family)